MRVGMSLPQLGPQATRDNLILVARRAEQLGYDSLWVLERLLWPVNPREPYPAPPGMSFIPSPNIDAALSQTGQLLEASR